MLSYCCSCTLPSHQRASPPIIAVFPLQRRIDDLEAFYIANVDDERSVLFEKQRLRLRKLLSEYDGISAGAVGTALHSSAPPAAMSAAPPASSGPAYLTSGSSSAGAAAMAGFASAGGYGGYGPSTGAGYSLGGGPSGAGSAPGSIGPGGSSLPGAGAGAAAAAAAAAGTITKEIREDTRLTLSELLAWFTQAGVAEMPEVAPEFVEAVFANVTRTNTDGKMSVSGAHRCTDLLTQQIAAWACMERCIDWCIECCCIHGSASNTCCEPYAHTQLSCRASCILRSAAGRLRVCVVA